MENEQELRRHLAKLEALIEQHQEVEERLAHLASFPEQNPNLVIELSPAGTITYLNPVAKTTFSNLIAEGINHPLLQGIQAIVASFANDSDHFVREIDIDSGIYEQKICLTADKRIRIFAHDVTGRRQAEQAVQRLIKQIVIAQEEERKRISCELHDEAGQSLTALKIGLELTLKDTPASLHPNLQSAIALIDSTREQIRLLARGLRPPALDTLGLGPTLEDFCRTFSHHTKLPIIYHGQPIPTLSDTKNISLYRFLQEAVNNAAKHAQATQLVVELFAEDDQLCLVVQDNGLGLTAPAGLGIGLLGLRERLAYQSASQYQLQPSFGHWPLGATRTIGISGREANDC